MFWRIKVPSLIFWADNVLKPLKGMPCVYAVNVVKMSLSCDVGDEIED